MNYKYNKEQEELALQMYKNGKPYEEIASIINVSIGTIYNILRRNNIKRDRWEYTPNYNEMTQKQFIKTFNHDYIPFTPTDDYRFCKLDRYYSDYFDNIDNQDKAYILGFLYADGSMTQDKYRTSITLQERDKEILEKMSNAIGNKNGLGYIPNNHDTWQNCYILRINSKRVCDALYYHGLIPKKSLILEFPLNFPFKYYKDFLRGYIDGDGCIGASNCSKNIRVDIISTRKFCETAKLFIENYLHINCYFSRTEKNNITTTLTIGGRIQSLKFLDWLYEDANLYLERKYQKYLDIKKSVA